jgi:BarA-like signal transduction histidine kinase
MIEMVFIHPLKKREYDSSKLLYYVTENNSPGVDAVLSILNYHNIQIKYNSDLLSIAIKNKNAYMVGLLIHKGNIPIFKEHLILANKMKNKLILNLLNS